MSDHYVKKTIKIVKKPQFTTYLWGEIKHLHKEELILLDRNKQGDCRCLVPHKGMVEVDHRDVQRKEKSVEKTV